MTKREMYEAIVAGKMTDEIQAKAQELLEALDHGTEARVAKAAEKKAEKLAAEAHIVDAIVEMLGEEAITASEICEAIEEIATAQKATVLAKRAVAEGRAAQVTVKREGRTVKGYVLA